MDNEVITTEAVEAPTTETPHSTPAPVSELDMIASQQGWKPKEEFTGDPKYWKDSGAWIKDGEKISALRKLQDETAQLRDMIAKQTMQFNKLMQEQADKETETLRERTLEAARVGDVNTVAELTKKIEKLKEKAITELTAQPQSQDVNNAAVYDFQARNPWWKNPTSSDDYIKVGLANKYNQQIVSQFPNLSQAEQIKLIEQQVNNEFAVLTKTRSVTSTAKVISSENIGSSAPTTDLMANLSAFDKGMIKYIENKKGSKLTTSELKAYIASTKG